MSKLWHFDIMSLWTPYNLRRFVETGTGCGDSLVFACKMPFASLWSCEIERVLVMQAQTRLINDPRVELFIGTSHQMLTLLPNLPVDEPILFWLDAHFPGADYGLRTYGDEQDLNIRLPLKDELALIRQHRPNHADIIIIDDARIWLDDAFQNGAVPDGLRDDVCPAERGIGFIEDMFATTHDIEIRYDQEGQFILTPKQQSV